MMRLLRHFPNFLTGLRLFSAPIITLLLLHSDFKWALAVFAFAGVSDALDGFLAKRFGLETDAGRWLDPAADKLLMLMSLLALAYIGATPKWLTALVIARDVAIVLFIALAKYMALPLKIEPSVAGKITTAVQVAYVGLVLLVLAFRIDVPMATQIAEWTVAVVTLASWLDYTQLWLRALALRHRRPA
jgi:cardiolipin synthase (CMP-forming)